MVVDGFIFVAATFGSLASLHVLERTRRRLYHGDLVVRDQADALDREKAKSDRLLLNVMPASISARLRDGTETIADEYPDVSILFADIVGFTGVAAQMSPVGVLELLGSLYTRSTTWPRSGAWRRSRPSATRTWQPAGYPRRRPTTPSASSTSAWP